ncbi:MAG TPA: hypothetical protein EYH06_01770 [Chromatiales bacterium]|nr:hypothetical protein [Chromatiales bacterium]
MKVVSLFFLILLAPYFVAAGDINVIDLNNKTAEEIIPLIEPLLQKNDALTGTGYQLILRTDKSTLQQIKKLLDKIDTRPRNLLISVRNNTRESGTDRGINTSGSVIVGDHSHADVAVHGLDRRGNRDSDVLQKIRVLEGERATISAGKSVPYRTRQVYQHGHWVTVRETVDYEDVGNSFYVLPRVQGQRVTLEIEPAYSNLNERNGQIQYQSLETQVSGKLGEWISLGNIDQSSNTKEKGILSTRDRRQDIHSNIEVKVEILQ